MRWRVLVAAGDGHEAATVSPQLQARLLEEERRRVTAEKELTATRKTASDQVVACLASLAAFASVHGRLFYCSWAPFAFVFPPPFHQPEALALHSHTPMDVFSGLSLSLPCFSLAPRLCLLLFCGVDYTRVW